MKIGGGPSLIFLLILSVLVPLVTAEEVVPDLSPEAEKAFHQGLEAVKGEDWELAARYFAEAQKQAPVMPAVLFNLGLAHGKTGHELAGIAWLHAYLAIDPEAPNVPAVREEIDRLKGAAEEKVRRIFQEATAAAEKLEDSVKKQLAYEDISYSQAWGGDIEGARESWRNKKKALPTMKLVEKEGEFIEVEEPSSVHEKEVDGWAPVFQLKHADSLVDAGDPNGALELLGNINLENPDHWSGTDNLRSEISEAFVKEGDLVRAKKVALQIRDLSIRGRALGRIAEEKIKEGDFVPAEEALSLLDPIQADWLRALMARAKVNSKDLQGALEIANRIRAPWEKASLLTGIAFQKFEQGDVNGAKALAKEVLALGEPAPWEAHPQNREAKVIDYDHAVVAHALVGNFKTALSLMELVKENPFLPGYRDSIFGQIGYIQVRTGDEGGAKKTMKVALQSLRDADKKEVGPPPVGATEALVAEAYVAQGEVDLALQILKGSEAKWYPFLRALRKVAEAYAAKGEIVKLEGMAKEIERWPAMEMWTLANALKEIAEVQAIAGELEEAEKNIARIPESQRDTGTAKAKALVTLGRAQGERGQSSEAVRSLASVSQIALTGLRQASPESRQYEFPLLEEIAEAQEKLGDLAGARLTRKPIPSDETRAWLDFAYALSKEEVVVNLEKTLQDASTKKRELFGESKEPVEARAIPGQIADIAEALSKHLMKIRALEKRTTKVG